MTHRLRTTRDTRKTQEKGEKLTLFEGYLRCTLYLLKMLKYGFTFKKVIRVGA